MKQNKTLKRLLWLFAAIPYAIICVCLLIVCPIVWIFTGNVDYLDKLSDRAENLIDYSNKHKLKD